MVNDYVSWWHSKRTEQQLLELNEKSERKKLEVRALICFILRHSWLKVTLDRRGTNIDAKAAATSGGAVSGSSSLK